MEENRYKLLLEDPETFESALRLRYVEILNYEDSSLNTYKKGELDEKDVEAWLNKCPSDEHSPSATPKESLRIISTIPGVKKAFTLTLSRQTFENIFERWQLPRSFLYITSTLRARFRMSGEHNHTKHSYVFQTSDIGTRPFSCAVTFLPQTNQTLAFLCGPQEHDFDLLCKEIMQSKDLIGHPYLLPLMLMDLKAEAIDVRNIRGHRDIHNIKLETGMKRSFSPRAVEQSDFVHVSRMLTRLGVSLASCEMTCEAHLMLLDSLDEASKCPFSSGDSDKEVAMAKRTKLLQARSKSLRGWMQENLPRTKYLSKRAQAYVQTVYSLMAKQDNDLNKLTAEASLRVSKASYQDSAAMKAIAEESKQVALATSRDSSLMRIIAILTLIFLPATFTATLFSTTFFDFKTTDKNAIVSPRFWLYWVVTLSLTAITMGCAAYFWRIREKKIAETFRSQYLDSDGEKAGNTSLIVAASAKP